MPPTKKQKRTKSSTKVSKYRTAGRKPAPVRSTVAEVKNYETFATWTPTAARTLYPIGDYPAQGHTDNQRIGKNVYAKRLEISCILNVTACPQGSDEIVMEVWLDKQANGAAAAITDIYKGVGALELRNVFKAKRFKMLARHKHDVHATGSDGDPTTPLLQFDVTPVQLQYTVPLNYRMTYLVDTESKVAPEQYSLYMVTSSSRGSTYTVNAITRFWFSD